MRPEFKALIVSLVVVGILIPLSTEPAFLPAAAATHEMAQFGSYAELIRFIQAEPSVCSPTIVPRPLAIGTPVKGINPDLGTVTTTLTPNSANSVYSTTNVQVQGVDELDTVKTDGTYIYTITNNRLTIVKAYPTAEAGVVSRIAPNGTLTGVFIYGNNLVLIGGAGYGPVVYMTGVVGLAVEASQYYWYT